MLPSRYLVHPAADDEFVICKAIFLNSLVVAPITLKMTEVCKS